MKFDANFHSVASIALTFFPPKFHFVHCFMLPGLGNPFVAAEFLYKKKKRKRIKSTQDHLLYQIKAFKNTWQHGKCVEM